MSSRDYIVRQIEQLSSMLSVVLGLKREQKPQLAEITIDEYLKRVYGLSLRLLRSLPEQEIIRMCDTGDLIGREKLFTLGMALKEDGDLQRLQEHPEDGLSLRLKSLNILLAYEESDEADDDRPALAPIGELLRELQEYELPIDSSLGVWRHYGRSGRYADAENELFELLARLRLAEDGRYAELVSKGVAFYEQLLELDDDALIDGNLPRAEIVEALNELQLSN